MRPKYTHREMRRPPNGGRLYLSMQFILVDSILTPPIRVYYNKLI